MDEDRSAEIAELRRRLFGPDHDPADADADAAALARLRELEGAASTAPMRRGDAGPDAAGTGTAAVPTPGPAPASGPVSAEAPSGPARPRPRRLPRRRVALLWAASVLVAAVGSAGITAWLVDDARGTVAVLGLDLLPAPDNATYLSVDTGSVVPGTSVADFHGITVARVPTTASRTPDADPTAAAWSTPAAPDPGSACLIVGASNPDGSVDGPSGCGAGSVFAHVAVVVTADAPQELRDTYPIGTTLVFEDEGGPVRVRVADR